MANEYLVIVDQDLNVIVQNNVAEVQVTSPALSNNVTVTSPVVPAQIVVESTGLPGPAGPAGEGVPAGGNAGEFLSKVDGTDFNTQWTTASTGHAIADEGVPLPQRGTINFIGAGVTVTDNAGGNSSDVTISATGGTSDHGALTGLADDDHAQYALADGTRGNFEPTGTASSEVAAHVAAPDPHSQYLIQAETDALYEDIGSTAAHVAELDPHTQYQKETEKGAANGYASLGADTKVPIAEIPTGSTNSTVSLGDHNHAGVYDPSGTAASAVSTHEGLLDPHPQYLTPAEADLAYDAIGAATSGDSAHVAAGDPHAQYQLESEKGAVNGYAPLDATGKVPEANLPTGQAPVTDHGNLTGLADDDHTQYHTDARGDARYDAIGTAATAVSNHEAALDPHAQYQKESEKAAANGYASLDAGTKVPIAQIPTGTTGTTTALGNHAHAGVYDPAGTAATGDSNHLAAPDPHPQYLTPAEADAAYDATGTAAGAVSTHEAGVDVHSIAGVTGLQGALDGKSATTHNHDGTYDPAGTASSAITAHEAAADPHPQYVTDAEHALIDHTGLPGVGAGGGAAIFFGNNASNPDPTAYNFWVVTA